MVFTKITNPLFVLNLHLIEYILLPFRWICPAVSVQSPICRRYQIVCVVVLYE